ncbi:phage tail tube protein [Cellulosilyticum sp. ST5]|uniref:phage tail tube protein n=1 Tax=Cellulosilyticum sp. ST5 TaxID=3055805 RepID=UPI0039775D24
MALTLTLSAGTGTSTVGAKISVSDAESGTFTDIPDLQEVPEMGGDPEQIDVTTLKDTVKRSIPGVKDLGDLSFVFLYSKANYLELNEKLDSKTKYFWKVEFSDGLIMSFEAIPNLKLAGGGVNTALTYSINMSLQSEIVPSSASVGE